jgi:retinol dehydrogenase-12
VRTAEQPDLTGRVVLVTGANSGIGLETAAGLAALGATVVMAARSPAKGEAAVADVRARTGNQAVELGVLDLSSFASIRAFAAWFLERHERLDVLVNNAGLMLSERRETAEGFEEMFGVNHLGHFLLTDLLLDRLKASAPSRVVVLSSTAHRYVPRGLRRDDLQSTRRFRGFPTYCRSKLANLHFARELARRLDGTGVTVNAVHPGSINSHFAADTAVLGRVMGVVGRVVLRTPAVGARTPILLASSTEPRIADSTGGYWSRGRRWRPSRAARRDDTARWLWEESERLVAAHP